MILIPPREVSLGTRMVGGSVILDSIGVANPAQHNLQMSRHGGTWSRFFVIGKAISLADHHNVVLGWHYTLTKIEQVQVSQRWLLANSCHKKRKNYK